MLHLNRCTAHFFAKDEVISTKQVCSNCMHNKLLYRAVFVCVRCLLLQVLDAYGYVKSYMFVILLHRMRCYSDFIDIRTISQLPTWNLRIPFENIFITSPRYLYRHMLIPHEKSMACSPDDRISISEQKIFYLQPYEHRFHWIWCTPRATLCFGNWIFPPLSHA